MKNRTSLNLSVGKGVLLGVSALLVLVVPIVAGMARQASVQAEHDRFEVVSIRPFDPNDPTNAGPGAGRGGGGRGGGAGGLGPFGFCGGMIQTDPGRLTMRNISLFRVIALAYGKNCRAAAEHELFVDLPAWAGTQRYIITATMPPGSTYYSLNQLADGQAPKLQSMLRNMLEDRFHLTLHRGSKESDLYNLVVVRMGKIVLAQDQTPAPPPPLPTEPPSPIVDLRQVPRGGLGLEIDPPAGRVSIEAKSVPIAALINIFQGGDGRLVIDKTGLTGLYDIPAFSAHLAPFEMTPGAVWIWPDVMEQLGLKLQPSKGPVETLVIERVERPTEN